jgi:hypothetical protein
MIEELKLLIPLLQNAGEGVFWLILAFFGLEVFKALMWATVFISLFYGVYKMTIFVHRPEFEPNDIFQKICGRSTTNQLYYLASRYDSYSANADPEIANACLNLKQILRKKSEEGVIKIDH